MIGLVVEQALAAAPSVNPAGMLNEEVAAMVGRLFRPEGGER